MKKFALKAPELNVRNRMRVVLGLLGLMLIAGAVIGIGGMQQQNDGMGKIYEEEIVPTQLASQITAHQLMSFILLGESGSLVGKPDQVKAKLTEYAKLQAEMEELKKQLAAIPMGPSVKKYYDEWRSTDADYTDAKASMVDALNQGDNGASDLLEMQVRPLLMQRQDALGKMVDAQRADAKVIYDAQVARYHFVRTISIISLLVGLVIAAIMAMLLMRSILSTLGVAVKVANAIADGKLGHKIETRRKDELGELLEALRTMDERLGAIVGEVRHGAGSVSSAAQQIARGNDDLSQRTQEQASSLEETASSMEEMTSTVKQNAENASHANQLASATRRQAEHGGEVAAQASSAMREINDSSRKISDIVSLIDEIAFQTNLLALNAAVEAARAGEQGRGFAVVATEVRNLAQRSAGAAKEIKGLINDSAEKVRVGSSLVDQSGKALADIVESVKKVTDIVAEIAAASQEQSAGIDQVNHAVLQMDEMTQQNAALVEEAAAAARAMQEQAGELARQVGFFQMMEGGEVATEKARSQSVMAEAEAVFAAVRSSNAPAQRAPRTEAADAGSWKEF
ncbi:MULTISPECIES: methyl-accepting chemotaxis protein [unclassified Dyella]|jgi:methyl-accepting chemotaxis protein|uniref:methyl-accepting chemotaxis protein n=1 Tax=unclassified Dyella TaxID=2634549 RepID=UPI000C84308C|nr:MULTISPECIES: methyl-accepting chemotaxis protein [unclassified Dyella]MDR3446527.1 methyl-accepting chemotaxis protein [Dyella sp.]PMQ03849.1 Methyl-accepting chemotaxis protein I [Dyella sp. AD56]